MLHTKRWKDSTLIALDTEATAPYPMAGELCEIAAVKWQGAKIVDSFQTLVKPTEIMSDKVIGIHGITNEMVSQAPTMATVVQSFHSFIRDGYVIAHHAPFDMGFLANEFEKFNLDLPKYPVFCSSILSQKLIPTSPDYKLQTLVEFLKIEKRTAHRALNDALGCLAVFFGCMERLEPEASAENIFKIQGGPLEWQRFSLVELKENRVGQVLIDGIKNKREIEIVYRKGSAPRIVIPHGMVRNPKGDFMAAFCLRDKQIKRFYLNRIFAAKPI